MGISRLANFRSIWIFLVLFSLYRSCNDVSYFRFYIFCNTFFFWLNPFLYDIGVYNDVGLSNNWLQLLFVCILYNCVDEGNGVLPNEKKMESINRKYERVWGGGEGRREYENKSNHHFIQLVYAMNELIWLDQCRSFLFGCVVVVVMMVVAVLCVLHPQFSV